MRKMILICPRFRKIEYGIKESFERQGIEVYPIYFNMGMSNRAYYQRLKHKLGFSIDNYLAKEKEKFNALVQREYNDIQPEFVYVVQGRWMSIETLKMMKKKSFVSLYLWDMISLFPEMKETFRLYDIIYSFDINDTKNLQKNGYNAKFKPSGYDSRIYYPLNTDRVIDVSFVGAMYHDRVKLLKKLIKELPDIKWEIYGEYAPIRLPFKWLRWRFSSEHKYFKNKNISKEEVNLLYNKSKIVLSIVRSNQEDGWSARLPEILGTCTFQITNYYPSVEREFEGCLATYKNSEQLVKIIKYYLNNMEIAKIMAKKGYDKVLNKYSDDALNKVVLDDCSYGNNNVSI